MYISYDFDRLLSAADGGRGTDAVDGPHRTMCVYVYRVCVCYGKGPCGPMDDGSWTRGSNASSLATYETYKLSPF